MVRGSKRSDIPSPPRTEWINHDCPIESWEYWESENKFSQKFTPELRLKISGVMNDLADRRRIYSNPQEADPATRIDPKQIERDLKKTIRNGIYQNERIEYLIVSHDTDLIGVKISEKSKKFFGEFINNPEDFLIKRAKAEPKATWNLYELFKRHGFNVSLGSSGTLFGKEGMSAKARKTDVPETPFVEFARRCVWGEPHPSARFCARVMKEIQRFSTSDGG